MPSVMSSVAMALLLVGSVAGDATMGSCVAGQGACTGAAEGDGSALLQVTKQKADRQTGQCRGYSDNDCPPSCCLTGISEHYSCQPKSDFAGGACPGISTPAELLPLGPVKPTIGPVITCIFSDRYCPPTCCLIMPSAVCCQG
mmetsp:Transcript_13220/g.34339  ORF Transcript_13220/g.34339 Transcript_13220/m.34339 type:complete len:143 (-) Transcript_13220:215-643(-)